jgi:hypothetical protein
MDRSSSGVRGAASGNLLNVPYDVSARTASLDVVKLLLHSVVSDNKKWFTIYIKDFYLGIPLPSKRREFIRIERKKIPDQSMLDHHLDPFSTTTTTSTSESKNACMVYPRLGVSANFGS